MFSLPFPFPLTAGLPLAAFVAAVARVFERFGRSASSLRTAARGSDSSLLSSTWARVRFFPATLGKSGSSSSSVASGRRGPLGRTTEGLTGEGEELRIDLAVSGESAKMPSPSSEKCGVGRGLRWCAVRCLWGVRSA